MSTETDRVAFAKHAEALRLSEMRADTAIDLYVKEEMEARRRTLLEAIKLYESSAGKLSDMASVFRTKAESARHELQLLDTPELPNLFPPCTSAESPPSPK